MRNRSSAGGQQVPLVFNLWIDDGSLTATMDSPAQGAEGIPVDEAVFEDDRLTLRPPQMGATYTGVLTEDQTTVEGVFSQGGMEFDLDLTRGYTATETSRPQDPRPPYPYEVEEVRFTTSDAGITLAGTITRPGGEGPFPAVVLISGSGQQNRNEEVFGHRPFHVIADALTRAGIAVLRYDDRGVGESEGTETVAEMTTRDSAGDAAAALAFLDSRAYVDRRRAGLIGHSEGALIALMIATGGQTDEAGRPVVPIDVNPDSIILLAGTGYGPIPLHRLLTMSSGVDFDEDYANPRSDINVLPMRLFVFRRNLPDLMKGIEVIREAGTFNQYSSSDSMVLGLVLEGATGRSPAQ